MSAKPYEQYLAEIFVKWITPQVQAGARYQFKSPDLENAKHLFNAFLELSGGESIVAEGVHLPCIPCGGVRILPVLHSEESIGFTENYISHLRDGVAGREGDFANTALLIIHNSMLDTLINSALDLAGVGAIWNPVQLAEELTILINAQDSWRELSKLLLDEQLGLVSEDGATIFGFRELYNSLADGRLEFKELGLFNDPVILEMAGQSAQLKRRLEENRKLYRSIEHAVEHFSGGQLETALQDFSAKFIREHFVQNISRSDSSTWERPAPTIKDIWELFQAQEKLEEDSLYAALASLNDYEIFESDVNSVSSLYDLISGVTVIELAKYPGQIQNLVVALSLDLFYAQMQKTGKPEVHGDFRQITKMILVDEADNFMSQNFSALRKLLKEGREYGVGVILSTQDITHFKTGENDYSAYILTWVVHRVSQIRNADIKAIFNKDDKGDQEHLMETIRRLEKHQSLYVDGDKQPHKMKDKAFWELLMH